MTRNLEGEPLQLSVLFLARGRQLVALVVLVDQILQDSQSLPVFLSVIGRHGRVPGWLTK